MVDTKNLRSCIQFSEVAYQNGAVISPPEVCGENVDDRSKGEKHDLVETDGTGVRCRNVECFFNLYCRHHS